METTFPSQEIIDSTKSSKLRRYKGAAVSAALLAVLSACGENTTTHADTNPPTCTPPTEAGDFTITATFPANKSMETATIHLSSEKEFALGNFTDYKAPGDWVTSFSDPTSNNLAIQKHGEYVMTFQNTDLNGHMAHLLLQGHSDAPGLCEVAD
jgi:hypothetical protein